MYMMPGSIEIAIKNLEQKWTSSVHKIVAENLCLCNPQIVTMDDLMYNIKIINNIPEDKLKLLTLNDARKLELRGI